VSALEKRCSGMADRCDDLMGKYESMLRRTTQVEVSVGLMRSRFETYPPHTGDKDQNTHQAHTGYIGSTDNK